MLVLENGIYVAKKADEMPEFPTEELSYEEKVVALIREKYSVNEELAIQRQRDSKPGEFDAYFSYCEDCKQKAKQQA